MSIVISDIEGTLTTGSSWKGLRSYYKTHYDTWGYNRFYLSWVPRYLGVKLGLLSRKKVMSSWMQEEIQLFRGVTRKEFCRIAEWIFEYEMWPKRRQTVLSALEAYRREGAQIVVVSSAYQPIVDVFAHQLKAEPIGSPLIFADDRLIGVSLPINAYEHKAEFVRKHYERAPILAAYGDTVSDLPMMEMSQEPVAVYPDAELRRVAEARGWRILEH